MGVLTTRAGAADWTEEKEEREKQRDLTSFEAINPSACLWRRGLIHPEQSDESSEMKMNQ